MSRDESRRSKRYRYDRDFELDPHSQRLMRDYDDERTLDEEEALEGNEDTFNELSHLQKESDMPLKDLLEKYGYGDIDGQDPNKAEDEEEEDEEEDDEEDDDEDEDDEDPANYESDLKQFYTEMVKAEENGENFRKISAKDVDSARTDGAETLASNINAHMTASGDETKVEGDSNISGTGEHLSASGNQSPNTTTDVNPGAENANSIVAPTRGTNVSSSSRLLRSVSRPQSEEEEDDCDYSPDDEEDWKKTIMVGNDYQAPIPEGLCKYDDALPYENEDKMLWDPSSISEDQVKVFLERAQQPAVKGVSIPSGSHVRDDEQALYLLLQCGYNIEEALRRRGMNVLPSTESVSIWSEEECHNFESGIRNYGKDFYLIHKHKVRTRSVGELVQFYYLWKKTERHDIFTYKARMEKKKYALHPGITHSNQKKEKDTEYNTKKMKYQDYMDRFLEEQEGVRDRSSSPNVNYLMHTDNKRQRVNTNSTDKEEPSSGADGGKPSNEVLDMSGLNSNSGIKIDNWDVSANSSVSTVAETATITTSSITTPSSASSGSGHAEVPTLVNSGPMDSLVDHHHNSSVSTIAVIAAASQLDYAKPNNSTGVESSISCAAVTVRPPSNTSTSTTINPISSSSTSTAAPTLQQQPQQQQNNQFLHMQQQVPTISVNKNENESTLSRTRTPENTHAPP